ncbi:hypothetical protein KADA111694_00070 [Kaistella daneshvariae]
MRNLLLIGLLVLSVGAYAQGAANPFTGENTNNKFQTHYNDPENLKGSRKMEVSAAEDAVDSGPGQPGDPLPVDHYIPVFILVAVGLIFYKTQDSAGRHRLFGGTR